MEKGKIIFLNGVTSSGKTSIVEALQDTDDLCCGKWFVWRNDWRKIFKGELLEIFKWSDNNDVSYSKIIFRYG